MVLEITPIPPGFNGTLQEYTDLLEANAQIRVPDGFLTGSTGSIAPTSNVGPWFKNGGKDGIFVWDDTSGQYVPINQNVDVGKIEMFSYTSIDTTKWLVCSGIAIPRAAPFDVLFNKIGIAFGNGDGSTTFNIPDLRGRAVVGSGRGSGLSLRPPFSAFGEETHQLTFAELPALNVDGFAYKSTANEVPSVIVDAKNNVAAPNTVALNQVSNNNAHNNMQPSFALVFCIRYA